MKRDTRLQVFVPESTAEKLRQLAARTGLSVSAIVSVWISERLAQLGMLDAPEDKEE